MFAFVLPYVSRDFNDLFMVHAAILAVLFLISFFTLRRGPRTEEPSPGIRVMSMALTAPSDQFSRLRARVRSAQRTLGNNRSGELSALHVGLRSAV